MIQNSDADLKLRELDAMCVNESKLTHKWYYNVKYLAVGILFGIVFVKAEIISWFRIQEMFRHQLVSYPGNVSLAVVSHVWSNRQCCADRYHFGMAHKKIQP